MIALRLRRREPSFRDKRLAVGLFGSSAGDRWPRRNRLPASALARLGHFLAGAALGLVVGLVLIWLATWCP